MNARLVTALALGALGIWAGCTAFDDAILPNRADVTTEDGGTSASSSSSSSSGAPGCKRHVPTERGTAAKPGGDIEIVVVVKEIHFGIDGDKPRNDFGYDLDGVCSCKENQGSCKPRAGAPDGGICDGDEGRDDGTGRMVASLIKDFKLTDPTTFANSSFASGERSILMRIQNYNGELDDDEVRFSLYRAQVAAKPVSFAPDEGWNVNEDDIATGTASDPYEPITFSPGYVVNGELVVNDLVTSRIPFNGDSDLLLKQVRFTGKLKLNKTNSRWNLEDVVGVGRWPIEDALRTVSRVRDPQNNNVTRLCESPLAMALARAKICSAADIAASSQDDRNTTLPCSAISAGMAFVTVPSTIGGTYPTVADNSCAGKDIGKCD